jgi:hypothetical protein
MITLYFVLTSAPFNKGSIATKGNRTVALEYELFGSFTARPFDAFTSSITPESK